MFVVYMLVRGRAGRVHGIVLHRIRLRSISLSPRGFPPAFPLAEASTLNGAELAARRCERARAAIARDLCPTPLVRRAESIDQSPTARRVRAPYSRPTWGRGALGDASSVEGGDEGSAVPVGVGASALYRAPAEYGMRV